LAFNAAALASLMVLNDIDGRESAGLKIPMEAIPIATAIWLRAESSPIKRLHARRIDAISPKLKSVASRQPGHDPIIVSVISPSPGPPTSRNWASENGYPRDYAERALAHTILNQVEAAYHTTDLLDQRRDMMEAWSQYVCGTEDHGNKVVHLNRGRINGS